MTLPTLSNGEGRFSAKELTELTQVITSQILEVQKHNASGTADTHNPLYGPYADGSGDYGVFSIPGIRPEMFSAFQRPRSFSSILGIQMSRNANEKIGIMTGVTGGAGTNPTGFCGTAPTAGQLKLCVQNYIWGKSYWKSSVVNVAEAGEYVDYADTEQRILNLNQSPNPLIPDMLGRLDISNRSGALLANELFTLGAEMERNNELVLIQGNETTGNANTQRGFIQEYKGLERQIITGRVDMNTGVACPAADRQVINMTYMEQLEEDIQSINFQFSSTGNHGHRANQMNTKLIEFLDKVQTLKLEEIREVAKRIKEVYPPLTSA